MRRFKNDIITLLFFLSFLISLKGFALKDILFSSFFAEKNLSSPNITCFFQDSKGFMWIGTMDGLNYFNGKTIKTFKHNYLDKNSLLDNLIVSICEDKEGNIWVGSGQGVSKLNPDLFIFENYSTDSKRQSLGFKIHVNADREKNIWATCAGLYKFNPSKNSFEKIEFRLAQNPNRIADPKTYTGIFQDSKKRYWVSCNNYLYLYFPKTGIFEIASQSKTLFLPVIEDENGDLYCGSWKQGILKINANGEPNEEIENNGIGTTYAVQHLNGESILWCEASLKYDLKTRSFNYYKHSNKDMYSPKSGGVTALYVDKQNQLWIGYETSGIQIVSPSNQIFKTFIVSPTERMFATVTSFIKSKKFNYIGGWYSYSVARLDNNYKLVKSWQSFIPKIYSNNISDAWLDPKGNIWFTSTYGLIKFNEETEKTEVFSMDSSMSKKSHFLKMVAEGDSVLWLSGYFCGLSRFSLTTKKFQNWGAANRDLYWDITKDNSGMIWLADNSGILKGFDPKRKTLIKKEYRHLTENAIYYNLLFDSISNALWVASSNGLLKVDLKTFGAKLFTERDNLPTNQINSLQFDANHKLWIATNKGLCFYDSKQNIFKTFFSNNGLPSNTLDQLFKLLPSGELLIGCGDGFSVLDTKAQPIESAQSAVIINKVYESGRIVVPSMEDNQKIIRLNHDQNNIQIEFSSNDLISSEDNQLLFRLEGFDEKWYTARDGIVNYSKLAPGKYLMHVSGIDHSGMKSKQEDYLSIIIDPPFWKTNWFISLSAICIFVIALLSARYVFTRNLREKILVLEKEQAIEKERTRISQDMHDELGSGLTKISIMSEVAMTQINNTDKAKEHLKHISSSSRELVDNLQDIIWILNSKNDSLENLCAYIREYALKYFEPFNIQVIVDFPENIPHLEMTEDKRRNVFLVFKESFNNISKHSGCGEIKLKMALNNTTVSFIVSDNGKGFDKGAVRNFANGLENMQERMNTINGFFEINSVPKNGTTTEFVFTV
jgi:signal transduction histidine kinase/streptogramin lyase